MQVSAINLNNNFKGETIDVEGVVEPSYEMRHLDNPDTFDKLDRVDFKKVANAIDNNTEATKHTSPIRFFLASTALATASFVAFRAAAFGALSKMDGKFPLFNLLDKSGKAMKNIIKSLSKKLPKSKAENIKGFLINIPRNILAKVAKYGKTGLTEAEIAACKKPLQDLYAKNALKKGISTLAGAGAAGLTITSRYKDEDGNGIPDKAEKVLGVAKEAMEIIPVVYSAMS